MTQASTTECAPSRRRWFRFSLRTMLIFTTLICAGLGWVGKERMQSWREAQFAKEHPNWRIEWHPPDPKWQEQWRHRLANFVFGARVFQIFLSDPKFSDLTPVAGLKNLQRLDLTSTAVTDLKPLAGLKNLKWLGLGSTPVTDLKPLTGLKSLVNLDLTYTQVTDLTPLAGLKNLHTLGLYFSQVTDLTPVARLKNLQRLALVSSPVTDLTPPAGLKNLQYLNLDKTRVTGEQVKWLQEQLPNCKISR